jgi:N-dimethylarginine dimethylaminohydrolase
MTSPARILLVDPSHYDVSYRINPWMDPDAWARDPAGMKAAAQASFESLRKELESLGCEVIVAQGRPGLPDMVFPANAGIVLDGRALLARFRYPERRGEEAPFLEIFEGLRQQGILKEVAQLPEGCFQEGAGDAIWDTGRRWFWAGFGPRSSRASLDRIRAFFGEEVVGLELASDRCYHLDVCFCPLSGGEILYYPPALTRSALETLQERVEPELLIEAEEEDLAHFNVNAVNIGRDFVTSRSTRSLRARLVERGYRVHEADLSPFMMSGGGAYCMTLRLDRRR